MPHVARSQQRFTPVERQVRARRIGRVEPLDGAAEQIRRDR